jgi:23S rRNA (uracil1939-C5)-methyltransferase
LAARRPASPLSAAEPFRITRLGADGDGLGEDAAGQTAWIALSLPGETVLARRFGGRARVESVTSASSERVAAPCAHFGTCGGCALQHWNTTPTAAWKTHLLAQALTRAGYTDPPLAPLITTRPATRRRVDLAFRRDGTGFRLGLHARLSDEVVDLSTCLVLEPSLAARFPALRALLPRLRCVRRGGSAILTWLDAGPDLLLRTDAAITALDRTVLADFARAEGYCRISHARGDAAPETACLLQPPSLTLSGHTVSLPPGAFLQASRAGEAAIISAVLAGLPVDLSARARIAELYAGCGTLSFALASRARVTAWEGDAQAVAALRSGLSPRIEVLHRDLARQPLSSRELSGFAALVLDPPWQGAAAQMSAIASADVPAVIYVSCNPAALARDAAMLCAAGYAISQATPIDQFVWSARLESVVSFVRMRPVAPPHC